VKSFVIPSILVGIVLVAGIFAFIPVQQSTAVHDSITDELDSLADAFCGEILGENSGGDSPDFEFVDGDCVDVGFME